jgi:hypothetical protein
MIAKGTYLDVLIPKWCDVAYWNKGMPRLPGLGTMLAMMRQFACTGIILLMIGLVTDLKNARDLGLLVGMGIGLLLAASALCVTTRSSASLLKHDLGVLAEMVGRGEKDFKTRIFNDDWPKLAADVEKELIAIRHRMLTAKSAELQSLCERYGRARRAAVAFGFDVKNDAYYEAQARELHATSPLATV